MESGRKVTYRKLPWGVYLVEKLKLCPLNPAKRKPFSVVKIALCPECANCSDDSPSGKSNSTPGWHPFNDERHGKTLLGSVDYSWLFAYALALYFSGFLADRLNLRLFLTVGMLGSGLSVCLLGVAYFANIHAIAYFIVIQILGGLLQSSGWPGVVAVMSHWFGKHNRGLIMGIWNSHTSVGNILGTVIPSLWADCGGVAPWGWSFLVPGLIIMACGYLIYMFLVVDPTHVGLRPPVQHLEEDLNQLPLIPSSHDAKDSSLPSSSSSSSSALSSSSASSVAKDKPKAINFFKALLIPGVVEYSLALFFTKLVSYTFLFWLPFYVKLTHPSLTGPQSDWLATLFDIGGIIGGIVAGVVSDLLNARAITCVTMLLLAIPMLFVLRFVAVGVGIFVILLIINGVLINGPYAIITTAVSSDLGTHPTLKSSTNAKATVTAIIDGTGSMGAATGPLLVGLIADLSSWAGVFYFLMTSCLFAAVMLSRLVIREAMRLHTKFKKWRVRSQTDVVELQRLQPFAEEAPSDNEDITAGSGEHIF